MILTFRRRIFILNKQPIVSIALILNYSRSGGTLLSRCLASIEGNVVLSEIHPDYGMDEIKNQLLTNYGIELKSAGYKKNMQELLEYCTKNGKQLIIRDWTFLDFTPHEINAFSPSNRFSNLHLLQEITEVRVIAFVRNPIDIWISRWYPNDFFKVYDNFISELVKTEVKVIKYEDFCLKPEVVMQEICGALNLQYDRSFLDFNKIDFIKGDTRSNFKSLIELPNRKFISRKHRISVDSNTYLKKSNGRLDYSNKYDIENIETHNWIKVLEVEIVQWVKDFIGIKNKDQY